MFWEIGPKSRVFPQIPRILPAIAYSLLAAFFVGVVLYARHSTSPVRPNTYLYLEVGGSLLCFCYAANALVRFRGTMIDRADPRLRFGAVRMIETLGYFGLNDLLRLGPVALSHVPMGWMVGRTLLAVLLLAHWLSNEFIPTARQPSRETCRGFVRCGGGRLCDECRVSLPHRRPRLWKAGALFSRPWERCPASCLCLRDFLLSQVSARQEKRQRASCTDIRCFWWRC